MEYIILTPPLGLGVSDNIQKCLHSSIFAPSLRRCAKLQTSALREKRGQKVNSICAAFTSLLRSTAQISTRSQKVRHPSHCHLHPQTADRTPLHPLSTSPQTLHLLTHVRGPLTSQLRSPCPLVPIPEREMGFPQSCCWRGGPGSTLNLIH